MDTDDSREAELAEVNRKWDIIDAIKEGDPGQVAAVVCSVEGDTNEDLYHDYARHLITDYSEDEMKRFIEEGCKADHDATVYILLSAIPYMSDLGALTAAAELVGKNEAADAISNRYCDQHYAAYEEDVSWEKAVRLWKSME